jgi:hypothetical protein
MLVCIQPRQCDEAVDIGAGAELTLVLTQD